MSKIDTLPTANSPEPMSLAFDVTNLAPNNPRNISIPDKKFNVKETFGLDIDWEVPGYGHDMMNVPAIDPAYQFDHDTTLAILAGFAHNRRVMVQGYHGTGKSTHIEQVAARLNWPCVRINLDSHVSRIDLIGKDMITLREGKQITEYKEGLLPWALQNPVALVFDEYDAGRPGRDVRHSARAGIRWPPHPPRSEHGDPSRIRPSACLRPPTRLVLVIQRACITARTSSIKASSTAGTSSRF